MASPFTAKQGHIMPCTDILKQGRSTLVTTVQMFKILGLLCLSTAYSLSVMYLQVTLPTASSVLCPSNSRDHVALIMQASLCCCQAYIPVCLLHARSVSHCAVAYIIVLLDS